MKTIKNIDKSIKSILLRLDLDVPVQGGKVQDETRLEMTLPTLHSLLKRGVKLTIIGHLGRPKGVSMPEFSMKPVRAWYARKLAGFKNWELWENLRFESGEEANDLSFTKDIVRRSQAQVYVFDAFAVSHREHASVIQIPKFLPAFVGARFVDELDHLSPVRENPRRPLVFLIGGAKPETKLPLVSRLARIADSVLVGGTLALMGSVCVPGGSCITVADVASDGLDITEKFAQEFSQIISTAGTVVWNGPMGKYEESDKRLATCDKPDHGGNQYKHTPAWGTYIVAKAMSESLGYTVIGGGDTEAAATKFHAESGIDWISSGGGAMLHYLAYGTLPFLEVLQP